MQHWLESKTNIGSCRYDMSLDFGKEYFGTFDMSDMERYYDQITDYDIFNTDCNDLILHESFTNNNNSDNVCHTPYEEYISNRFEKYIDGDNVITILIPPGTNRYHANYLFKRFMDIIVDEKFNVVLPTLTMLDDNGKKSISVEYDEYQLLYPHDKLSFYKFCYNYTHKETKVTKVNVLNKKILPSKRTMTILSKDSAMKDDYVTKTSKIQKANTKLIIGISLGETQNLIDFIDEQMNKIMDQSKELWDEIKNYICSDNSSILNKLCPDDESIFYKWMFDHTIYIELMNLKIRLTTTEHKLIEKHNQRVGTKVGGNHI